MILWLWQVEVVEYRDDSGRSSVAASDTEASANNYRSVLYVVECVLHVEIQWLCISSWLLCTVEHSDLLDCLRNGSQQVLVAERTEEVYAYHTYLFALLCHIVDSLASSLRTRTHEDDHALSVLSSVVVEDVVLTTCDLCHLVHVVLYDFRQLLINIVARLTMSEESLRVLSCTACYRALRRECAVAETLNVSWVYELGNILLVEELYLVVLV